MTLRPYVSPGTPPRCSSGTASSSRAVDLGSKPAFPVGRFPGRIIPVISKSGSPGAWCYRSGLGLVGPVSVQRDWVRLQVWSPTSVTVWQHVQFLSRSVPGIHYRMFQGRQAAKYQLTLLLSTAYTTWGAAGRKRRLSAARRNAWAGGMLNKDSVSLTPLIRSVQLCIQPVFYV